MTEETKNTTKTQLHEQLLVASPLSHDVKTAVLIVSVFLNLAIFTAWIAIQVTSQYDRQLASLLFNS